MGHGGVKFLGVCILNRRVAYACGAWLCVFGVGVVCEVVQAGHCTGWRALQAGIAQAAGIAFGSVSVRWLWLWGFRGSWLSLLPESQRSRARTTVPARSLCPR